MVVLDTSALVAFLEAEPGAEWLESLLDGSHELAISAATFVEAGIVVEARRGEAAGRELDLLLHRLKVQIVAVDADQAEIARAAYRRFGKGRHPAKLNFGDCFAYALAMATESPLAWVGDDFTKTDVTAATRE